MKKNNTFYIISLVLSLLVVFATLYLPKTFYSDNDLANITCGLPLPFVQGKSYYNPPFPWQSTCIGSLGSALENQIHFLWLPFFLNVVIVFVLLNGVFKLITLVKKRGRL